MGGAGPVGSAGSTGVGTGGSSYAGSGSYAGAGGYGPNPGICGNAISEWPEQCDDGNEESGDGCSSACEIEPGYVCSWDESGTICEPVSCGDGRVDGYGLPDGGYFWESCDDANIESGDGCSDTCETEPGWICNQPGATCREPVCGDGFADYWFTSGDGSGGTAGTGSGGTGSGGAGSGGVANGGMAGTGGGFTYDYEACDDGNTVSGDGCDATCEPEPGFLCEQPGSPCRQPRCGDNFVDYIPGPGGTPGSGGFGGTGSGGTYEGCDDGNVVSGDGCDTSCRIETGWACETPGACHPVVCGDGLVDYIPGAGGTAGSGGFGGAGPGGAYEGCDDGNVISGDGCDTTCRVEDGWACWYQGAAACHPVVCGDQFTEGTEQCDDGNQVAGDGCHECVWEGGGWGGWGGGGPTGTAGTGAGYAGTGGN